MELESCAQGRILSGTRVGGEGGGGDLPAAVHGPLAHRANELAVHARLSMSLSST
jgi:hypothetical protein